MGWLGDIIRKGAPIAATIFGSPAAGAIVGGAMGAWGASREAKGQERAGRQAGNTAMGAFNYLSGSPVGTQYLPAGGAAVAQQQALLGLGGDPAAAQAAYDNYLSSIGYQGQMEAGQRAVTGSAAARGLLGSGSTAKGLARFGQQLGRESFGNYLAQLSGLAGMGLQAGGMLGNTAMQGYGQAAGYQYGSGMQAAGTRRGGWDQLMGGIGEAYDAWNAGRTASEPATAAVGPAPVYDNPPY